MDAEFSMFGMTMALEGCGRTAPGEDRMCYVMFQHAPDSVLEAVLGLFNKMCRTAVIPAGWRRAVLLPFVKLCKDPGSYRPIVLTSNICKLMGKDDSE